MKYTSFVIAILFSCCASICSASIVGLDDASASAYSDGWQNADDGSTSGDAFGAWGLSSSFTAGFFIGDSTGLSSPGADINASGSSFGMFGASGSSAFASRSFNGGGLAVGQSFLVDLAVNFRNGSKGINVDAGGGQVFNFNTESDDYVVNGAASGNGSIGSTYNSNTSFSLNFTQTSLSGGSWEITRNGGVTDLDSGTYTGQIDAFELYVSNTDGGSFNDLYANNLAIVPEPTTMISFGICIGAFAVRRRRAA